MELILNRKYKKEDYCIGELYANGVFFSNTLEDTVRDINKNGKFDGLETKIKGETAIPYGTYNISLDVSSPKFSKYSFYQEVCNGKLPRLLNVPSFEGVLIHVADGPKGADLLEGCIGIGKNNIVGGLTNGKEYFKKLYKLLYEAKLNNEEITIKIV